MPNENTPDNTESKPLEIDFEKPAEDFTPEEVTEIGTRLLAARKNPEVLRPMYDNLHKQFGVDTSPNPPTAPEIKQETVADFTPTDDPAADNITLAKMVKSLSNNNASLLKHVQGQSESAVASQLVSKTASEQAGVLSKKHGVSVSAKELETHMIATGRDVEAAYHTIAATRQPPTKKVPSVMGSQGSTTFDMEAFDKLGNVERLRFMREHPELDSVIAEAKNAQRIEKQEEARKNRGLSTKSRAALKK